MGTTVWVDDATRRALRDRQEMLGTSSVNETIRRLLDTPTQDARTVFALHRDSIGALMRRHHARRLVAFGSRARGDARPDSDLDLAVEFDARASPLAPLAMEADLSDLVGLRVELVELPNRALARAIGREGVVFER